MSDNQEPTKAMVVASPKAITAPPPTDIQVTAENADEMAQCQRAIVVWCKAKVTEMKAQAKELKAAYEYAKEHKWRNDTLKRHSDIATKRVDFYQRMLSALEHGYQIVPSFPVTAFAIRTSRESPLKMVTTSWNHKHTQEAEPVVAGEGEYKNPFPVVMQRTLVKETPTTNEKCEYWADAWKDLEFPISMAKPKIMEATTRAMALKIFDEIGILPGYAPNEGTRPPRGDPIIVARLKDPRPTGYQPARYVTFIIAWHLDTRSL